jgi:2-alkyl-3-oxoalkanoate reductase
MKLLLTGATGFVGRNILLRAIREGKYSEIHVPVRSVEKLRAQFLGDGFETLPSNVIPLVMGAHDWDFSKSPSYDHVIHSAGVIFARTEKEYNETNVEGTLRLLRTLNTPGKVIILSSQAAAGPCPEGKQVQTELDEPRPLTWYGKSKLMMEEKIRAEFPHLNYLILRPPMIFGPRDQATLPLFKMVRNWVHVKPGFRSKLYSVVSVDDLAGAIFTALQGPVDWNRLAQRIYYICDQRPVTDRELIALSARAAKRFGILVWLPQPLLKLVSRVVDTIPTWRATIPSLSVDRAKEIWPDRWVVSPAAFQKVFEWSPKDEFALVVQSTHDWYVKTGQLSLTKTTNLSS